MESGKQLQPVLTTTDFPWLGKKYTGKVRDVYDPSDGTLILVATDRHSSFDRHIADIPRKGEILNRISAFWFAMTKDIVPNHMISLPDPNVMVAKKTVPLPIEAVMRGYLTGVTDTAIWTHYQNGKRDFGNFTLPDGMKKNQPLREPVFTPSTKEAGHDRTLSPAEILAEGNIDEKTLTEVERISKALFLRGQEHARSRGLILVDTKYEFGRDENGNIILIDEIHTPDSSRWWYASSYEDRMQEGVEPQFFDKEFLRLWFKEHSDPYKDATLPEAPPELIEEMTVRYETIYQEITNEALPPLTGEPINERIEKALKTYVSK